MSVFTLAICLLFGRPVVSDSLQHHKLQHDRPLCPSPSHEVSCPLPKFMSIASVMPSSHLILWCPLLLLLSVSQHQGPFQWVSCSHQRTKILEFQLYHQSFQWIFRVDWLDLLAVQGTRRSLLQHHSLKASILWLSAFFMVQLSHPYMTTGKTITLTVPTFVGMVCWTFVCFSMHCLGLSQLSCQDANVFWFYGCSHHLQWL